MKQNYGKNHQSFNLKLMLIQAYMGVWSVSVNSDIKAHDNEGGKHHFKSEVMKRNDK